MFGLVLDVASAAVGDELARPDLPHSHLVEEVAHPSERALAALGRR